MAAGSQAHAHFLHWLPGKKEEGKHGEGVAAQRTTSKQAGASSLTNLRL